MNQLDNDASPCTRASEEEAVLRTPVQQVRVTMDGPVYDVRAYDMFGQLVRHRRYRYGARRREWANQQARQWAERYYLRFEEGKQCD